MFHPEAKSLRSCHATYSSDWTVRATTGSLSSQDSRLEEPYSTNIFQGLASLLFGIIACVSYIDSKGLGMMLFFFWFHGRFERKLEVTVTFPKLL